MTGTPVYDPSTGTVYLTSEEVPPGHPLDNPEFFMHAINAQTGAERPGWPVPIQGSPSNDPGRPFTPFRELERPGMLLLDGSVYAAFASQLRHHAVRRVRGRGQHQNQGAFLWTTDRTSTARPASGGAAAG